MELQQRVHVHASVMVWNYHDDDIQDAGSPVVIKIKNLNVKKAILTHYRIDASHSNSYEVWKKMGSPQYPTETQIAQMNWKVQVASRC